MDDNLLEMLYGAMDELQPGNPWYLSTDVGPVIDDAAKQKIERYCQEFSMRGLVSKSLAVPDEGRFVAPTVIRVKGIEDMPEEIFGPVLHVTTFRATEVNKVIRDINARGYGLTFGLHTRMDNRIEAVTRQIHVGNAYVNRNQIGAIVGSQPFGGEGLSGTGPKAGGPAYIHRFMRDTRLVPEIVEQPADAVKQDALQAAIDQAAGLKAADAGHLQGMLEELKLPLADTESVTNMPGPTGETNRLSLHARGVVLCLGPDAMTAMKQAAMAMANGNQAVMVATGARNVLDAMAVSGLPVVAVEGVVEAQALTDCDGFAAVVSVADAEWLSRYRQALAQRDGVLIPLIAEMLQHERYQIERHLCIDTTAAGGNASLIAAAE